MDISIILMIVGWIFVLVWVPLVVLSQRKIHPKALFVLFFAELWERFSFYGMRALLILYMVGVIFKELAKPEAEIEIEALGVYGAYGALVYAAPVLGGYLADKIMGFRKAILVGGIFMVFGHFFMAFEGSRVLFFGALALIIVGNGFFKPNLTSFLGTFYEKNDKRKDGAFTIYYMGVNIGAFLAPLTCGFLGEKVSWFWGFGLAGIGMLAGLIVFWVSMKSYADKGLEPPEQQEKPRVIGNWNMAQIVVVIGSVLTVPIFSMLLNINDTMSIVLLVISAGILGFLLFTALRQKDKKDKQRLIVVIVLFFFHTLFWALFEQAGGSLTLFAKDYVNRMVLGGEIPTSVFQSLNPLFIMLLAPLFSWIWIKTAEKGIEPRTPIKFLLGLGQLALGFLIVIIGAKFFPDMDAKVPLIFLVGMYFFHTTGELSISPVGLSMVTKLSPIKIVGFVMGAWFLSISLAHEMAVAIGKQTAKAKEATGDTLPTALDKLNGYADVYAFWGVFVVIGAGIVLFALSFVLKRWMNGIN